jgi:hypothetical protein
MSNSIDTKYKEDFCAVCMENFDEKFIPLDPCGHYIHQICISQTGQTKCPICRSNLNIEPLYKLLLAIKHIYNAIKHIEDVEKLIDNFDDYNQEEPQTDLSENYNDVILLKLYIINIGKKLINNLNENNELPDIIKMHIPTIFN